MINNTYMAANLLRHFGHIISDEECKELYSMVDSKQLAKTVRENSGPWNAREVEAMLRGAEESDDNSILDKYAEFIYNYEYKYNDNALKVDPTTDTDQTHIGPMAQDIEKVNPAAVQDDPGSGYKTVDTGRLALMNAGAIADLAREIKDLKNA